MALAITLLCRLLRKLRTEQKLTNTNSPCQITFTVNYGLDYDVDCWLLGLAVCRHPRRHGWQRVISSLKLPLHIIVKIQCVVSRAALVDWLINVDIELLQSILHKLYCHYGWCNYRNIVLQIYRICNELEGTRWSLEECIILFPLILELWTNESMEMGWIGWARSKYLCFLYIGLYPGHDFSQLHLKNNLSTSQEQSIYKYRSVKDKEWLGSYNKQALEWFCEIQR